MAGTIVLPAGEWRARREAHIRRMTPLVGPRLQRRREGAKHPVDDFLFEYYTFRPGQLLAWHPGAGTVLAGEPAGEHERYVDAPGGRTADPAGLIAMRPRLERSLLTLRGTASRPAALGCFGMHEWAMVLGVAPAQVRHAPVPLRIDPGVVAATLDAVGLRCSHFDAYRFFSPAASGRQRVLTPADRFASEQPGCIHAAMDLYRFAYQASPHVPSELVGDCFMFARRCREVDMRASPYDLSAWGVEPIRVERASGRREYADLQRALAEESAPLREHVIAAVQTALSAARHVAD